MTATAPPRLPMILAEVMAVRVDRISPSYVRVELGGPALADFGVDGPLYDQRVKLVFPAEGGLPAVAGADETWLGNWRRQPAAERGHMRTYTVREVRGAGRDTRLVVDFVLHEADGAAGPGSAWASAARVGDRLVILAPRRGAAFGGIEFVPGAARRLLVAGDETAVPAACGILAGLPAHARGAVFLEVPVTADVQPVLAPPGVEVVWLPRDGARLGSLLGPAVLAHLGAAPVIEEPAEVDPVVWETPSYSSSGELLEAAEAAAGRRLEDLYAWIAGESAVVTGLRRVLVNELGLDRRQVAFMGYWRRGVAG
jgi:NADPH-dependent ferric siderophore reductase